MKREIAGAKRRERVRLNGKPGEGGRGEELNERLQREQREGERR